MSVQEEASKIAYRIGLLELTPVLVRLFNAEAKVAEQEIKISALQSTVLALKHGRETVAG